MDASIIVCTYNRAESLRETLTALRALRTNPDRQWEVIVVDNNSKDHTRRVVEEINMTGRNSAINSKDCRGFPTPVTVASFVRTEI